LGSFCSDETRILEIEALDVMMEKKLGFFGKNRAQSQRK